MHPTPSEQLRAVRQVLEGDDDPPEPSVARDAAARLRKLENTWHEFMSFLQWDNAEMVDLLVTHRGQPTPAFGNSLDALIRGEGSTEFDALHDQNKALRDLLVQVLADKKGPDVLIDPTVRAIAAHLRARMARDPGRGLRERDAVRTDAEPDKTGARLDPAPRATHAGTIGDDSDRLAESFPLSPLDDLMIHQTPDPVRIMWTSDFQAYERHWAVCHDRAGRVLVAIGGSAYPSLNLAEAYAIVNIEGDHRSVRAGRPLGADRTDMQIGPIRPTVIRGLRQWRYVLEPNEWGISFDLMFHDTTRQIYREPLTSPSGLYPGRQRHMTTGFESFGVAEGWVAIDGRHIELATGELTGTRDRHWGIGRGVGGPQFSLGHKIAGGHSGNAFVALKDFSIWGDRIFYRPGDQRRAAGRVRQIHRRVRFEPDTKIFLEAELDYELSSCERKALRFRRLGNQTAYLRCGFYGGTPDGRHHQGAHAHQHLLEGDRHDVSDPAVRRRLAGLDEHQCEVTCEGETVVGVFQPVDPDAFEACTEGRRGWAFLN